MAANQLNLSLGLSPLLRHPIDFRHKSAFMVYLLRSHLLSLPFSNLDDEKVIWESLVLFFWKEKKILKHFTRVQHPKSLFAWMTKVRLDDRGFLDGQNSSRSYLEDFSGVSSSYEFNRKTTTHCGLPALWIFEAEPFEFALVGKFLNHRPLLEAICKFFFKLKLISECSVTVLDSRHTLIKLLNDLDYSSLFGCPLKIDHTIAVGSRSSVAQSVWIDLENLGYIQLIVMEEFPPFCDHYKSLGHSKNNYSLLHSHSSKMPPAVVDPAAVHMGNVGFA
ncbi:hypothetical protein IEQ34_019500 [Dendrobium chrysotoxum]|uniref:Maturase K n=1 Tax=Dendrobium chrysotoxum TaxID=161865 RepID=A0AAV7G776_DENCH|nr:hypothetical protein IEQ34_019500 [Dendrobium chrysotoxum]